jgi:hypothetical protein
MFKSRIFSIIVLLLLTVKVDASPADSSSTMKPVKTNISYLYEKDFIYGNPAHYTIDTSVAYVHHVNPALDLHYNYLGTEGSANEPQIFDYKLNLYTFISNRSYDLHMLTVDSIRFFRTNKRFSEIQYHNGNFKEQRIAFIHTQNITKNWNAGFQFDRQGVKDFMNYSNTFRSRFALYTWYASPDRKYNLFAAAIWNNIKNGVNGGLSSDSLFDNTNVSNLGIKGLAYQISEASENTRRRNISIDQYYDLGKINKDTLGNIISRSPAIRLNYKFDFERKTYAYIDESPDSSFYSDFYYGASTYDSLHSDEIKNRFAIQLPADTMYTSAFLRKWSSGIYAEDSHVNYGQRNDSSWNNISVGANIFFKADTASPEFFINSSYVVNGFDVGNYIAEFHGYTPHLKIGRLGVQLFYGLTSPDLIYRLYDGNNFRWRNNFSSVKTAKGNISYGLYKYSFRIEAGRTIIDNYVYINVAQFPEQYSKSISIDQIKIIKNFKYRSWHFDNLFVIQNSDHDDIIPLSSIVSEQSLYYQKPYFNKALFVAFGASLSYNSEYFANAFNPATATFELQKEKKTGGYPRLDLFINARIKTASIFLKLENAADNIFQNSYYLTPHYPMPGMSLKFGVVWRFFDQ